MASPGGRESCLPDTPGELVFRPPCATIVACCVLLLCAALLAVGVYAESHPIMDAQIALGLDPTRTAMRVTLSVVGTLVLWVSAILRAYRQLLPTGEVRIVGSSVFVTSGRSSFRHDASELEELSCYRTGADLRLGFSSCRVNLPGLWLPVGWRWAWRGWRMPNGGTVKHPLTVATHPLLAVLDRLRPDIKPEVRGTAAPLLRSFSVIAVAVACLYPSHHAMVAEARRQLARPDITGMVQSAFEEGRYDEACELCRRALPDLRDDLYGSMTAARVLLYCGEPKPALHAVLGYDVQPFWPLPMDSTEMARIRIAQGRFSGAEKLLRTSSDEALLAVALAEQGRATEADAVLQRNARYRGLAHVLLLRHQGKVEEACQAAGGACSKALARKPATPSRLARDFEICLLAGGPTTLAKDSRFLPALRALPGLRVELLRFAEREDRESVPGLRALIAAAGRDDAGARGGP